MNVIKMMEICPARISIRGIMGERGFSNVIPHELQLGYPLRKGIALNSGSIVSTRYTKGSGNMTECNTEGAPWWGKASNHVFRLKKKCFFRFMPGEVSYSDFHVNAGMRSDQLQTGSMSIASGYENL
jgi:hypothetical protein